MVIWRLSEQGRVGRWLGPGVALVALLLASGGAWAQVPGAPSSGPMATFGGGGGGWGTANRPLAPRSLQGVVRTKDGDPVKDAIVYLKDGKTSSVKTMHVDDKGAFKFVQLSKNVDYELWAKVAEKKTPSKTVSSMDPKNEITLNLKTE